MAISTDNKGGGLGSLALGAEQQAMLDDFERKKKARSLAVPTDDRRVRARLRSFGEPVTFFGEGPGDRRDRLRGLMQARFEQGLPLDGGSDEDEWLDDDDDDDDSDDEREQDEEFFHPGGNDLFEARQFILDWTLPRASKRIAAQRAEIQVSVMARKKMKLDWFNHLKTFTFNSSQIGDDRPLSFCTFAPNSRLLATGAWSGLVKLWSIPDSEHVLTLKGHNERVSGIAFHPGSTLSQTAGSLNLVTSGMDGKVNLHNFESDIPIGELVGHERRVARVAFHPSGRYIGTTSFDQTWRLWDSETTQELLLQEGHSREVFAIGFQGDGALVATAGYDAIGRVWDLRSGRSIMVLQGHVKPILSLDWSPNGHILATGSEDNAIRIWDVRQAKCTYIVPAHTNLVSTVKFWNAGDGFERKGAPESWKVSDAPRYRTVEGMEEEDGDADEMKDDDEEEEREREDASLRKQLLTGGHLVSSSYDGTCKIFSEGDWKPLKSLAGLEGKVMGCDVSADGKYIATASYDRTFKLFSPE
ncbi:WD40 repeat-like protein [Rhizoclosmatium globosum]|uniref:WD40 repeat-like protein n=2 Tax=Rhizoclosmatium globosum TaxID=329046 RepID=A0A1Y2BNL4_9FUNG|nr:WD40 repeat-like protein [Rhizoclosmatium globosum]|eukprot:ORY36344.1 WD40 repeat-like protein [Rhizoclosmatium globosum]